MGGSCSAKKKKANQVSAAAYGRGLSSDLSVLGRYHHPPRKLEEDYVVLETDVLGTGFNGSVFKATSKHRKGTYAVKGFLLQGVDEETKQDLRCEVEIFLAMDHPHVARLVDVYENPNQLYLVMECMEGGELFERVQKLKTFSEKDSAHCVWQMLLSVNYIHSHGVVHRDIKLENFLFERKDNDHLKLIDFGFSKVVADSKMDLSCGTLAYVAPEVLKKNYTAQCDLWSMGVVSFVLLLGYMPFAGTESKQKELILEGKFKKKKGQWEAISLLAQEFLEGLLQVDPKKRFTPDSALKHAWIAQRDQTGRSYVTPLGQLAGSNDEGIAGLNVDENTIGALCSFAQASRFRRACMSLMAWSLSPEERSLVRDTFIELDTDRTGAIKLDEFRHVLEQRFNLDKEKTAMIIESLAVTNKDVIHYSEFLAAMVSTRIKLTDDHFSATFRRFDNTDKGYLTAPDLQKVLGQSFSDDEIQQIMISMCTTTKGQITYDQFADYLKGEENGAQEDDCDPTGSTPRIHSEGTASLPSVAVGDGVVAREENGALARLISKKENVGQPSAGTPKESDAKSKSCSVQ